jgi:hypothetical protein
MGKLVHMSYGVVIQGFDPGLQAFLCQQWDTFQLRFRPVPGRMCVTSTAPRRTLYNSTTRLNDGIFRVHRFPVVTPARLYKLDFIFRFYVYGGTFATHRGIYCLHVEQFLALYALIVFLDMLRLLVCFLPLFRTLWFGIEDYRLVVYRGVGSIPEELLLGQGRVFSI